MRKGRNSSGSRMQGAPCLGDLLTARPSGLTESEFWAVLCQAVQALQDLFLSDGAFGGSTLPLVTPGTVELSSRGRVRLQQSPYLSMPPLHYKGYLAPEYHSNKNSTDTEAEKMWIHALGETLKRATLTSHSATSKLSRELCQILADMTRAQVEYRASLMNLLDVISEYCKRRQQTRPFSHIVMDLHQEALASLEISLPTTWGPPAMPELRPLTRSSSSDKSTTTATTRRWHLSPTKSSTRLTREASTSMEDLPSALPAYYYHIPGSVLRPKSLCVPEMSHLSSTGGYNKPKVTRDDYCGVEEGQYGFSDDGERVYGVIREEVIGYEGGEQQDREINSALHPPLSPPTSSQLPACTSRFSKPAPSTANPLRPSSSRHRNRNPVQRAASRLYRANMTTPATTTRTTNQDDSHYVTMTGHVNAKGQGSGQRDCVGPEFVVRAALSSKEIVVEGVKGGGKKNLVQVIMLNGQKLDVMCNVISTTSGQIFEHIIQKEHIEENFMLGLSTLIAGDFVFLPSDTRISKAIASSSPSSSSIIALTLFLRVRFFLPSLRGIRGFQAKHLLYLQLRRSILEHQLPCNIEQLVDLNGYALQAEFGDYSEREHGTRDYFLLEHYVPETMSAMASSANESLRNELTRAHKYKKGLDADKAEEDFIQLAQTLPHYGGHFYTATWVLKDSSQKDVWLYVSAQGINIYERSSMSSSCGPALFEHFQWRAIRTLCYSKHYLCILPHTAKMDTSKTLKKYKLKMNHKKSYFTFRLASLHHQFFLRLRTEFTSLQSLSQQFGVPLKDIKNETNSLYKLEALTKPLCAFNDASVSADTEFKIEFRPSSSTSNDDVINTRCKRSKSVNDFMLLHEAENVNQDYQNKENESPYCKMDMNRSEAGLVLDSSCLSGLGSQNLSGDKRRGVKMGISAFSGTGQRICRSMEAVNIASSEDLEQMSLQSVSIHCSEASLPKSIETGLEEKQSEAYILDGSVKSTENQFLPDFHESLSDTLMEKLNNMSFAEERALRSVILRKDSKGSLGMQITEGSDGKIYIQSVIPRGPADLTGCIFSGDQIIAVNGQNLLCYKYNDALILLKNTQQQAEFTISQRLMKRLPKLQSPATKIPNLNINPLKLLSAPQETVQVEKYLTENCYDKTNFQKHTIEPFEVPYHKHIRYEIEPSLHKSMSKSCSQISSKPQLSPSSRNVNLHLQLPTITSGSTRYQFQSLDRKLSNKVELEDVRGVPPIALPRSLGLSRKWRGNVKYPVTPVKKAFTSAIDKEGSTYSSMSDEEQVFI